MKRILTILALLMTLGLAVPVTSEAAPRRDKHKSSHVVKHRHSRHHHRGVIARSPDRHRPEPIVVDAPRRYRHYHRHVPPFLLLRWLFD